MASKEASIIGRWLAVAMLWGILASRRAPEHFDGGRQRPWVRHDLLEEFAVPAVNGLYLLRRQLATGLALGEADNETPARPDVAVEPVTGHAHTHLAEGALPGEHVGVDGIDERAVQVEDSAACITVAALPWFTGIVPQPDDRLVAAVMLEAEHAHAGGAAEKYTPGRRRQTAPAGRDHSYDVAARECQHVAIDTVYSGDEAFSAHCHVFGRFTARAAITIEFPAGLLFQDVAGQLSLEAAVVPLDQVMIDFRADSEAGQLTSFRGTPQGTGEHAGKGEPSQSLTQLACMLLPMFIQSQIGSTRVLMGVCPGRVAVTSEKEFG